MTSQAEIGLIGLGVMGQNLALNIADHGHGIAVHNRTPARTDEFLSSDEAGRLPVSAAMTLEELVAAVRPPRPIILMVQAGAATDQQIEALAPLLDRGDIVIDGGNAHYPDTIRRETALRERGLRFLGVGISGGEEGARHGPSIMVGGAGEAYERVRPILEGIAAQVDGQPCCAHLGPDGAGHFVKMMHNGIEYADMQLIAETYALLKDALGLDQAALRNTFASWNEGALESYLVEITADILSKTDPETEQPMVEVILDRAGQKGTGGWAIGASLELGVPVPTIAAAVGARALSALKDERVRAAEVLRGPARPDDGRRDFLPSVEGAALAGKAAAYAEGFAVLRAAALTYDWPLDFATIARIWRGGCIIRAQLLHHIVAAYTDDPDLANLLLAPHFAELMGRNHGHLRAMVAIGAASGLAVPALAAALAYYDGYRSARLPANLIQAQRDYFGAHTYERVDRPGSFHSDWSAL